MEASTERCLNAVDTEFADIISKIEKRRAELQAAVNAAARDKKHVLEEQHSLIEAEKSKVERECEGLQYQVEDKNVFTYSAVSRAYRFTTMRYDIKGRGPDYYSAY